jgi:thiamine biosynthesis lipoprotein
MGTVVTIDVRGAHADEAAERAFGWFHHVEACCSRFEQESELVRLSARIGEPVPVSPVLFEAVHFAVRVAAATGGAFDPTLGAAMMRRGFDREHRTGRRVTLPAIDATSAASYHDVVLDEAARTIMLRRPLVLDLGAVAKGLAIDLAARELAPFADFSVNAGGDLYVGGHNAGGEPWTVGIRHPRRPGTLITSVRLSNCAVCTSGDYERLAPDGVSGHHIVDPRQGVSPSGVASATVIAPTALAADALATAAFVLGPGDGVPFLEGMGVEGLIVGADLACHATAGFPS